MSLKNENSRRVAKSCPDPDAPEVIGNATPIFLVFERSDCK
jgi:hypothetical protein